MTKDILKLSSTFLHLDDTLAFLTSSENVEPNENVKNQINQLIVFTNYIIREITKDYYPLYFKETISSDQDGKIFYNKLSKTAIRIKDVKNFLDLSCHFEIYPEYLKLENANTEYKIFYSYVPNTIKTIEDEAELPFGVDYFIVCYGVASEFALSCGLYDEAEMWESKFKNALRSLKSQIGERRFFARRLK